MKETQNIKPTTLCELLKMKFARTVEDNEDHYAILGPYRYHINKKEIQTETHLIGWIKHLCEKTWFSSRMCGDLIRAFEKNLK